MGLIPFIGNDSEDEEDDFNSELGRFADNTELSRGEQKESDEGVAQMHKSRSRKAFEENDQFSGSSGEWSKVSDSENSFSETDTSSPNFEDLDQKTQSDSGKDFEQNFDDENNISDGRNQEKTSKDDTQELAEGFQQMEDTLEKTVEEASQVKKEFEDDSREVPDVPENKDTRNFNTENQRENTEHGNSEKEYRSEVEQEERKDQEVSSNQGVKSAEKDSSLNKQEVTDSLEKNISEIKNQIESGNVSSEGLESIASRFEELVDRLENMDNKASKDSNNVSSEFQEDVREDLTSFQDELLEMREQQETLDKRYTELQNAVQTASDEEEDVRVEDINTIEKLDKLEEEMNEIKSGKTTEASEQVHMDALENEVKELRKDVRELSEAVVTISEKVFR